MHDGQTPFGLKIPGGAYAKTASATHKEGVHVTKTDEITDFICTVPCGTYILETSVSYLNKDQECLVRFENLAHPHSNTNENTLKTSPGTITASTGMNSTKDRA